MNSGPAPRGASRNDGSTGSETPRRAGSFGIMVNYLYDVETIESNHEAFVNDGTVMRSADIDALLAAKHIPASSESCGSTTP